MTAKLQNLLKNFSDQTEKLGLIVETADSEAVSVRLPLRKAYIRPGNTISGPPIMTLTDIAMYVAILNEFQKIVVAYTTNLEFKFIAKGEAGDLIAKAKIIGKSKSSRHLLTEIYSSASTEKIAIATGTFRLG